MVEPSRMLDPNDPNDVGYDTSRWVPDDGGHAFAEDAETWLAQLVKVRE